MFIFFRCLLDRTAAHRWGLSQQSKRGEKTVFFFCQGVDKEGRLIYTCIRLF